MQTKILNIGIGMLKVTVKRISDISKAIYQKGDSAISEVAKTESKYTYDVALWECWPALFPEHIGLIEASGSYAAVLLFMQRCHMEKAVYAVARRVGDAWIDRWVHLYMPLDRRERLRR